MHIDTCVYVPCVVLCGIVWMEINVGVNVSRYTKKIEMDFSPFRLLPNATRTIQIINTYICKANRKRRHFTRSEKNTNQHRKQYEKKTPCY